MSTDHEATCPTCGHTLTDEPADGQHDHANERASGQPPPTDTTKGSRSYDDGVVLTVIPRPRGMKMRA